MKNIDLNKFNRDLFNLLHGLVKSHGHYIFKDYKTNEYYFHIRLNGGFEQMTIEGKIEEDTLKKLESSLKEMIQKREKQLTKINL